ncbi:NTP transferase domain-containing protein [Bacteriovoracales bacterium]|nr:NTP transferase domain-containing protein [Bacteriovoracales bacterium]
MKIIIPMSGIGKRFLDSGYKEPKFLINVDGKPIIEHIIDLFPGEEDFIFICNKDHLRFSNLEDILRKKAPKARIVSIEPHKLGPVYAVSKVFEEIDDDKEVIVNYCDFGTYWDYRDFLKHTRERGADGAVPSYKGFHPHMLGIKNYAFIKEEGQWMKAIQEKRPFTENRMNEYASNGTYYFKKGSYVKKYFKEIMDKGITVSDEYYVSMVYNLLTRDNLKISVYEIQHMLQWGTPDDLAEYVKWSEYFKKQVLDNKDLKDTFLDENLVKLIPMAGEGLRFKKEGFDLPKPLIEVSGYPMVIQASKCLPEKGRFVFACLKNHLDNYPLKNTIKGSFSNSTFIEIDELTQGQASTCEMALKDVDPEAPLLISACDNGVIWDQQKFYEIIEEDDPEAIFWTFRNHPCTNDSPEMYGWLRTDENDYVTGASVKKPISRTPEKDHAIVGTFYFKKTKYFLDSVKSLYTHNNRVNNEFYVDSCAEELLRMNLKVKVFEVDHYICWGTPNDYKVYNYWQSFFHKCDWHPYGLDLDSTVDPELIPKIEKEYLDFEQDHR